jgi:predicted transcriptional regulator of viral defense system
LERPSQTSRGGCSSLVEKGKLIRLENGAYPLPTSEG